MAKLRVALIGAGVMGTHHARLLSSLPGAMLAGILDSDPLKAQSLAERYACPVLGGIEEVLACADAAIIASASHSHATLGLYLLQNGLPCLIEKPLAMTRADCLSLIEASKAKNVPLAVGHIERFNPAVAKAAERLSDSAIHAFQARRFNPGSARIQDSDVVIDLMIHDVDTVLFLAKRRVERIDAQGVALAKPGVADHATALLYWGKERAMTAALTASRVIPARIRELQIVSESGLTSIDYLNQEVHFLRRGAKEAQRLAVDKGEALAHEVSCFTQAVATGRMEAGVSADEALAALHIVWAVQAGIAR